MKLNVIDRAQSPHLYYSGGSPILILDDDVRCVRTQKGLRLEERAKGRAHDFNKQGEYIGSVLAEVKRRGLI